MKTLMKILSVILFILGVILVISLKFPDILENDLLKNISSFAATNILPSIAIAVCCFCLERNDQTYLIRIIPIYLTCLIVLSFIITFFGVNSGFIFDLYKFLSCIQIEIIFLSLIFVIKTNNIISNVFKYLSYILVSVSTIYALIIFFDNKINVTSDLQSAITKTKTLYDYIIIIISQIISILLLHITNYSFSEDAVEADDIDYDTVKDEAKTYAYAQMNNMYTLEQPKMEQNKPVNNNGMMNINNQLGQNSNVGIVTEQAKKVEIAGSTLDSLVPLANGPVINESIKEEVINTMPPIEEKVEVTTPPNLDIGEQMKMKMEQYNQTNYESSQK